MISSGLRLRDKTLFLPVLQHLLHAVMRYVGTLRDDGLLHGLGEGELLVKTLIDGVVLTYAQTVTASRIVPAVDCLLNTVAEEEDGIVHQRVGYHVVRFQHLRRLRLLSHGDRCLGIPRICPRD